VFDRLKYDPATRHIPVDIVSVDEEDTRGLRLGAINYLRKPVSRDVLIDALENTRAFLERRVRRLLVVIPVPANRQSVVEFIAGADLEITAVGTLEQASAAFEKGLFDCLVLDMDLPAMSAMELLRKLRPDRSQRYLPVILFSERRLTRREAAELKKVGQGLVIREAGTREQLFDLTALFLHREIGRLPAPQREMLERYYVADPLLAGRKVLIVDDDIRNIFALTTVLERYQMKVRSAENGRDAIECLKQIPDIDIVLMDIMMPGMDGYDTMGAIRRIESLKAIPILALTAKAMKGDREKCLEAGATDYLAKPVDTEKLLSLLRVRLYKA
jgi:CheY-like chemotaxis protein